MFSSRFFRIHWNEDRNSKLYNWWINTSASTYYYNFVQGYIRKPIRDAQKIWGWYWNVLRHDYDWDGHSLFQIIEYKLKRIQRCLPNGTCAQDPKDMKALRIAIKIAGRLKDDRYDLRAYDRHTKKWGKVETLKTPIEGQPDVLRYTVSRQNVVRPEDKIKERSEFLAHCTAADAKMRKEEKLLYAILSAHLRNLWD